MQHLFNRIYIAPIHRVECQGPDSAVVFLTDNQSVIDALELQNAEGELGMLHRARFKNEVGQFLGCFPSYDAMLNGAILEQPFGDDEAAFFRFLLVWPQSKRLVIFADFVHVERLLLRWFKTILPNLDKAMAFDLLHLISLREQLLVRSHKPSLIVPIDRPYNLNFTSIPGDLEFSYSDAAWDEAEPFMVEGQMNLEMLSLEFLLATYLHNKLEGVNNAEWAGTPHVEEKVLRFVKRRLIYSLIDDKDGIVQSLYHAPHLFGVDLDFTDPAAIAAFIAQNSQYSWLFDNSFKPDNYQTVWATYDIAEVFETGNTLIQKIDKEVGVYNAERHDVLRKVFKNNVTIEDVIDVETTAHFSCLILAAEVTDKVLNRYTLDYIFQQYKAGDANTLGKLSVEPWN
jgi:hypothetical protein